MADRTPVIAGIGLSDYPQTPQLTSLEHHILAMRRALADSGIQKADIDGYMAPGANGGVGGVESVAMAEYLGIEHHWIDGTMTGGSSFEFYMQHAMAAIREGYAETILVTYGSDQLSSVGRLLGSRSVARGGQRIQDGVNAGSTQYEAPYGNVLIGAYAMIARRHMHEFGTTSEQLAEIAVAARKHAQLNPHAMYRDPLTVEDVVNSRMIADPLHKLDCCVISDGGGAVLVTTAERAKDLKQPPVYLLGAAGTSTHWNISQMVDYTTSAAAICGPMAMAEAGITPSDVDTVQIYDSFTITVLTILEDLGFCKKGEGGQFVQNGRLELGGELPLNTDGGGLSSCHPGMRGIFLLIEAARQLRGQGGDAQVPDAKIAMAVGSGGWLSAIGAVVLGKEKP